MIMLFSALAEKRLKLWPKQGERNRMMLEGGRWFALPQTTRSRRPRRMPRARAGNCLDGDNEKRKSKLERKRERGEEGGGVKGLLRRIRSKFFGHSALPLPSSLSLDCMHGLFTWKWKHTIGHADVILGSGQSAVHSLHSPT